MKYVPESQLKNILERSNRMKRKAVWILLALVLVLALATPMAGIAKGRTELLTSQIDYRFVGHLGEFDAEGRLLVWEADISGDFTGTGKWWFGPPPATTEYEGGRVAYYVGRWEIFDSAGHLVLAGESAGKTVTSDGEEVGMWDGHGVVTEASKGFNNLKGRHVYETGPVVWDFPYYGTGIFVIH